MPIRFRCVYCNQLLGISRRKGGTIVRCTSCEGQLIVPDPNDAATEGAGSHEHAAPPPSIQPQKTDDRGSPGGVFDADEFDAFVQPLQAAGGGPAIVSPPAPMIRRPQGSAPAQPLVQQQANAALTLSRRGLAIAVVLAILGLGLSFAAGLWAGLAMR